LKWILGLGNPGDQYSRTRHNVGLLVLEALIRTLRPERVRCEAGFSEVYEGHVVDEPVLLFRPFTYMNCSGAAVGEGMERLQLDPADLLVIYDDADLALGRIRFRRGGSPGGHNGIRSILEHTGDASFDKLKIGVRGEQRRGMNLADYVLSEFHASEVEPIQTMIEVAAEAAEAWVRDPWNELMNEFHGRRFGESPEAGEETGS
jgi:PTH1 family peptidyl-tRNA hydrolase